MVLPTILTTMVHPIDIAFLSSFIATVCFFFVRDNRSKIVDSQFSPPTPGVPLPLLGHFHHVARNRRNIHGLFTSLSQIHSRDGMLKVRIFNKDWIIFSGYEAVRDIYMKHCHNRNPNNKAVRTLAGNMFPTNNMNDLVRRWRRLTFTAYANAGRSRVLEWGMSGLLLSAMREQAMQPRGVDLRDTVRFYMMNTQVALLFGIGLNEGDPLARWLFRDSEMFGFVGSLGGLDLKVLNVLLINVARFFQWVAPNHIRELFVRMSNAGKQDQAIVKFFYEKMGLVADEAKDNSELIQNVLVLLEAGIDTSMATGYTLLNYLVNHPHIQDGLYAEIQREFGDGRLPSVQDKADLTPYCRAVLRELWRIATPLPNSLARSNEHDIHTDTVYIPAGTVAILNVYGIHRNPAYYPNPEVFDPERWLLVYTPAELKESAAVDMAHARCVEDWERGGREGGIAPMRVPTEAEVREHDKVEGSNKYFATFGLGARSCAGRGVAEATLLMFVRLLALVKVVPSVDEEGNEIKVAQMESRGSPMFLTADPFKVRLIPRHDKVEEQLAAMFKELDHLYKN